MSNGLDGLVFLQASVNEFLRSDCWAFVSSPTTVIQFVLLLLLVTQRMRKTICCMRVFWTCQAILVFFDYEIVALE